MDTKHIHCMLEDMSAYGKEMISCMVGDGNVNLQDLGEIIDIVKDLACAEKDALIAKEMRKAHDEDEEEERIFLKMLKEEYKDEYKRMRDEYGEDEGEKRFYDNYRYKSSGRFAPKGKGSYMPRGGRRGYEEPHYYHMMPDYRMDLADYKGKTAEELRDMDRNTKGVMYYTEPVRSADMRHDMRSSDMRDMREGKSGMKRKGYMETKELHKDGSPESKQHRMKDLEMYAKDLTEDVVDMIADASPEERALLKQKMQVLIQKIG